MGENVYIRDLVDFDVTVSTSKGKVKAGVQSFKARRTSKTSSALEALWKTLFMLYLYKIGTLLVPSCFVIFDLEPLSLSFDFVFMSEIFKSLSFCLDRLCHLAILCLDQHAHTLHHLESLLTISLDRLDIFEGRSCISEFVRKSLSLILDAYSMSL
ncbi:hypothetical protein Tco_1144471 [Tanacetum coccineum]